jgi:O-antigen/teichoic acid export membrane protein
MSVSLVRPEKIRQLASIGGASAFQILCLTALSFIVARALSPEAFGITRVVAAYFLIAQMFGHLCLNDATATYVAGCESEGRRQIYIATGTWMVLVASLAVTVVSEIIILSGLFWKGEVRWVMASVFACIPFASLALLYTQLLQALGAYRRIAFSLVLAGAIPLALVAAGAAVWGIGGWTAMRCLSYLVVFAVSAYLVRGYVLPTAPDRGVMRDYFSFIKFQLASGVVSMCFQSADVIALERLIGKMDLVGYYGLGVMFCNASIFILHSVNRVFFKEMAESYEHKTAFWRRGLKLLLLAVALCLSIAAALNVVGPFAIRLLFGEEYIPSIGVLRVSSVGIIFSGLWAVI